MSLASGDTESYADAPSPVASPYQNTRLQDIARRLDRLAASRANDTNLSFSHENNGFTPFNFIGGCQARYEDFSHLKISENKLRGQNKFDDNV